MVPGKPQKVENFHLGCFHLWWYCQRRSVKIKCYTPRIQNSYLGAAYDVEISPRRTIYWTVTSQFVLACQQVRQLLPLREREYRINFMPYACLCLIYIRKQARCYDCVRWLEAYQAVHLAKLVVFEIRGKSVYWKYQLEQGLNQYAPIRPF